MGVSSPDKLVPAVPSKAEQVSNLGIQFDDSVFVQLNPIDLALYELFQRVAIGKLGPGIEK